MSLATGNILSTKWLLLHTMTLVLIHVLCVGFVVSWWGLQWLPQYFEFHKNKGFLNPELVYFVQPWFDFLALGRWVAVLCATMLIVLDFAVVYSSLRFKRMEWLSDIWSSIVIVLPLSFVVLSGTKMLDGYWGIHERIAQQKQRAVGQRARDFRNLLGSWELVSWEKDGTRETKKEQSFELTISSDGYCWTGSNSECLGGWNVYSSSDQNEISFVPNEVNQNAWGGQGYYRVTETRLALHLVNEPGFFNVSSFDSRTGGELWIFKRK